MTDQVNEPENQEDLMMQGIPLLDNLKKIQELIQLVETLKTLDTQGQGQPDWKTILQLGGKAMNEVMALKEQLGKVTAVLDEVGVILQADLDAVKGKHPDLIKMMEMPE